ncbi:MAG: DUF4136 domain-containing protein [Bacteroidales bacterium]|nr:DUF4136 domain-containing protein [Bacteroidales bacterium]
MKKSILLRAFSWLLILVLPLLIFSCYPGGPSATEDLDLVGTMYDPDFNFTEVVTYSMPDTVIHIIGENDKEEDVDHSFDELMLTTVKNNMDAFGYQWMELDTLNTADVVLLISAVSTTNSGISYPGGWWGYWGYWPGWGGYPGYPGWGPGWGYGYPLGYPSYFSYSTGSIFISMINPEEFDPENETIGMVWMAAMNGLLQGSKDVGAQRVEDGINQAFKQSEDYLKIN